MVFAETIKKLTEDIIKDTEIFIVDISVKPGNRIRILLDKSPAITIKECFVTGKKLEKQLLEQGEEYALEVSSPGLGQPLKVLPQYLKVIEKEVSVKTISGVQLNGILKSADNESIVLEIKKEIAKKKYEVSSECFLLKDIKETREIIKIK